MAPDLSSNSNEVEKQKNLDHEVREMVSALTSHLGGRSRSSQNQDEDDQGARVITLAGNNLGATMRGDMDNKVGPEQEDEATSYVVNSNFQAINNSIMLGGSYKTNDPGVHLDITDCVDHNDVVAPKKKGRKTSRRGDGHHHVENKHSDGTDTEKN